MLNIGNWAYVDVSLNSIVNESITLGNCQLLTYVIIRPRGSYMVGIYLYTVVWGNRVYMGFEN